MTKLDRAALARLPLNPAQVRDFYDNQGKFDPVFKQLCESHQRLQLEVDGAVVVAEQTAVEIAAVLKQLDELAQVWGDEGVFRSCRDRLRKLITGGE